MTGDIFSITQHHNRVINYKFGRERHQRQIIENEAAQMKGGEGVDEGNGNGDGGDRRGVPGTQE